MKLEEYIQDLKTLRIIIVDDEKSSSMLLQKRLSRSIEGAEISVRDMPEHLYCDLSHRVPLVVIVDWYYPGYDCSVILERLEMYKVLVCVFSNEDIQVLKGKIINCLGKVPKNFRVINKFNYKELENEIIDYLADTL